MWRSQDPRNYLYIPTKHMIEKSYFNDTSSTIIYIHMKILHLTHYDDKYISYIYLYHIYLHT
jgi:hypothetical protein